ncbi:tyrosine-type recombinase/integrase (plasmid) [Lichenicola cladoniae]|uniref:Tyrosine-type recombinase/integrase n=2 Tax=Lichenicola cladoniae TaxID=1484109 RepID=A0A6M8HXV7_9PROT|nr:tyrosine-type recombinase/integrase [Acetobacteraceae bacterium]QKE93178.1 tyrosine-type recombinase/integrase [Lichenicola cladoniae]
MSPRTIASLCHVHDKSEAPRPADALITAFLSSFPNEASRTVANHKAAARHFLYWIDQKGIAASAIDDTVVRQFEGHRCRCHSFSRQGAGRPEFVGRVRRFVSFLEDHGAIELAGDIDNLAHLLTDYDLFLKQQRYCATIVRSYRSEAAHFAAWVRLTRQRWAETGNEQVECYAHHDCRCPVRRKHSRLVGHHGPLRRARGARRFLSFLRDRNILPDIRGLDCEDKHLHAYSYWLKHYRGSADTTITRFCAEIKFCLPLLGQPSDFDAGSIRNTISHRLTKAPGSAALVVTIMRSYLRFLIFRGECSAALLHAIPPVRRYQSGTLPRYLDTPTIEKIVDSCGAETPVQIRDRAIILLLARLGLRAGDICHLRLSDIDWNRGYIQVSGKSKRLDRLPLPQDAGDAVLAYLEQARPTVGEDRLFLRTLAPFTPFKSSAEICGIVSRVYNRAGITGLPTGSHLFRHSLATRMLQSGAGLESIGTILRHRSPATTAIYAKVNVPMLEKIAQSWPGEVSC